MRDRACIIRPIIRLWWLRENVAGTCWFNSVSIMVADHYNDVIMGAMASQITSLTIVYSTVYSGADQRKHQSSAWLAFVGGIRRGQVNSPHKGPVTRKIFPFDDVIMWLGESGVAVTCYYYLINIVDVGELANHGSRSSIDMMQAGVLITRYNVTGYCIHNCSDWDRTLEFELTKDTPYFALTSELWVVYCKDLGEHRSRYKGIAVYCVLI